MTYSGANIILRPSQFLFSWFVPYQYPKNINTGSFLHTYAYTSTGADDQYILMTFYPPTVLDKNNPITPVCETGSNGLITFSPCTTIDVYYASGTVRMKHTTTTTGWGYRHFRLNNFPTSSFAITNQTVSVYFQIIDAYQVIFQRNITVSPTRTVEKCTLFNFGVVSVSSLNGG